MSYSAETQDTLDPRCTIYVGGLDQSVTEELLYEAFIPFGPITEILLPKQERNPEKHKKFAFVVFESLQDAHEAVDNMHLSELLGKVIQCQMAKPGAILEHMNSDMDTSITG